MAWSAYETLYKVLMNINESGCRPYGMASALIVIGVSTWYPDKGVGQWSITAVWAFQTPHFVPKHYTKDVAMEQMNSKATDLPLLNDPNNYCLSYACCHCEPIRMQFLKKPVNTCTIKPLLNLAWVAMDHSLNEIAWHILIAHCG